MAGDNHDKRMVEKSLFKKFEKLYGSFWEKPKGNG